MGTRIIKLPDVGEGVAEAEIVEWHVEVGQSVLEDQLLAAVMTDKATVEIPSPVAGVVAALGGEVGSVLAVGAELVRLEVAGEGDEETGARARGGAAAGGGGGEEKRCGPRRGRGRRPPPPKSRLLPCLHQCLNPPPYHLRLWHPSPLRRSDHRGRPARSRSPRPPCGGAPARPVSICARCAARGRLAASATMTSMLSCAARPRPGYRPLGSPIPRLRPSRSSACAGASPRRWRSPSAGSLTSPMSRKSTLPRSRNCARP